MSVVCVCVCASRAVDMCGAAADEGGGEVGGHGAAPHRQLQERRTEEGETAPGQTSVQSGTVLCEKRMSAVLCSMHSST